MKCRLCLEDKNLLRKSHIIPNFLYSSLFDEKHRIHLVSIKNDQKLSDKILQSGEYEGDILCARCDNQILGEFERYVNRVLFHEKPEVTENRKNEKGMTYTYCAKLDYTKFKLFLLSIIWRASISKSVTFKDVKLGPYEDEIRRMILNNNPSEPDKFPCLLITHLNLKKYPHQYITQPNLSRASGGYVYYFPIAGMLYLYFISDYNIPSFVKDCVINKKGELKIIHSTDKMAKLMINKSIGLNLV